MDSLTTTSVSTAAGDGDHTPTTPTTIITHTLRLIQDDNHDPYSKIEAAKEIRRLTKTSQRCRRQFSDAIVPLVSMLRSPSIEAKAAALLALLNLAVQDETNKISIVDAGALEPIVTFLHLGNLNLQEHATASLATLSATLVKRSTIGASGAIPFLVELLGHGNTPQVKMDAIMALCNLSSEPPNLALILQSHPIPYLVNILKSSKKSSKISERCTSLLESLVGFEEGRVSLTSEEGGVLAVVEVLERGSPQNREHADFWSLQFKEPQTLRRKHTHCCDYYESLRTRDQSSSPTRSRTSCAILYRRSKGRSKMGMQSRCWQIWFK
ncbi:U-box domain-containing protein 3-like isoform X2 [Cynara cardunculus var. scolymus]|uniref:U-box domain-containing protein 3-like isoform X2 n=1 Tax=Cynara cardunculus var. scolymus TaxID=59895 RepID=UPI000D62ADC1|nr:U-box domain-containing protein 3-like isoform X2 [Cynara cardunculus var. scolymus]